ncbi:MAG: hypothetical protein ACTSRX_03840 [Promethearchaeota archaeon]
MILQIVVPIYAVILLLITGVAAILFSVFMVLDFLKNKKIYHLLWAIAFFVLFAAGVILVIGRNYEHLLSWPVSVLGVFIPGGIAGGLFYSSIFDEEKSKKIGLAYLIFVGVGAVLILLTKTIPAWADLAKWAVMLVHIPSGLAMVSFDWRRSNESCRYVISNNDSWWSGKFRWFYIRSSSSFIIDCSSLFRIWICSN